MYKVFKKSEAAVDEKAIEETMHAIEEDEKTIEQEVSGTNA